MTESNYYDDIYPEYPVIKGEDLNITRMQNKHLKRMWYDKISYPYIKSIEIATGIHERTIYNRIKKLNLPKRETIL